MRRFFYDGVFSETATLSREESTHILRVLRMAAGDKLVLIDAEGGQFLCALEDTSAGAATVRVIEKLDSNADPRVCITLYQACLKSDNLETTLKHCVELGISGYAPFISARCVRIPDAKGAGKLYDRMTRIAAEAVKQCGRGRLPEISRVLTFADMLAAIKRHERVIFAYECETTPLRGCFEGARDIALIIGPEGGFDASEAQAIKDAGAQSVSLGRRILRAETAALALTAIAAHETDC